MNRREFLKKSFQAGTFGLFTLGSPINLYSEEGKLCVVLDDADSSLATVSQLERLAEQNIPVTVSVLPNSAFEKIVLDTLSKYENADILLHQPMEYEDMSEEDKKRKQESKEDYENKGLLFSLLKNPTIYDFHTSKEAVYIIHRNITRMNKYIEYWKGYTKMIMGINNHQGSLITQEENFMRAIAEYCFNPQNNLILLDSRTTPKSVMYDVAKEVATNIDYAKYYKRNWAFLDDDEDITKEQILQSLNNCYKSTLNGKNKITIGHLWSPATIDALIEFYEQNKNLVKISDFKKKKN